MRIIYEPGLETCAQALSHMGFELHALDDNIPADAILFSRTLTSVMGAPIAKHGALIVNVRGLTAPQIAQRLRRRCESTLF